MVLEAGKKNYTGVHDKGTKPQKIELFNIARGINVTKDQLLDKGPYTDL